MKDKPALYFLATEESETQNRNQFRQTAATFLGDNLLAASQVKDWSLIFQALVRNTTKDQRLVIVIDEFQYLGKANPAFPSIFQKIWDTLLSKENVMVILCGSLIRMMESQTLNYNSPLYGRRTAQIKMEQIPFRYYGDFFEKRSFRELVTLYSITGGVPKYIELFEDSSDIYEGIRSSILDTSSFLYDEPRFLLQREVNEVGSYYSIIKAIAAGNHKLSSIATVLEVPQSHITKYLKTLSDLDIIQREVPVTESSPEKSKKGLYFIKDNFIDFWFKFIFPNMGYIELGYEEAVIDRLKQNLIDSHTSFIYEDVCREQLWQLSAENRLGVALQKVGRWWNNADEIDVIGLDEAGSAIVFGECKFWQRPVGIKVLNALQEKASSVPWHNKQRTEQYVLFSVSGFTPELKAEAQRRSDVMLVSHS